MNESTNRYETSLPFKDGFALLPDNYELCRKRLMSLYKTWKNDPELLETYDKIFKEQLSLGIIEQIDTPNSTPGQLHYLPHHPVIRFNKETTKVRAVFDASANVKGNPSLNDCLQKGPQLTPLIFDILLRFHCYAVALTADKEKAFLQIGIVEPDNEFLRFLWFDDVFATEPKMVRNCFARVIFGVKSSPFLLNGTVRKHTSNYNIDSDFITKIVDSFFVDDFTGGEDTVEKAYLFKKLKLRFLEGRFNLRKWRTNDKKLRELICDNDTSINLQKFWESSGVNNITFLSAI